MEISKTAVVGMTVTGMVARSFAKWAAGDTRIADRGHKHARREPPTRLTFKRR